MYRRSRSTVLTWQAQEEPLGQRLKRLEIINVQSNPEVADLLLQADEDPNANDVCVCMY